MVGERSRSAEGCVVWPAGLAGWASWLDCTVAFLCTIAAIRLQLTVLYHHGMAVAL